MLRNSHDHLARLLAVLAAPPPLRLRPASRYACVPVLVLCALLTRYAFLGSQHLVSFTFFFVAVALSGWLGGRIPGLLAVALSALAGNYVFLEPGFEWSLGESTLRATGMFLAGGSVVAILCGGFREALLRARETAEVQKEQSELLRLSHDAIFTRRLDGTATDITKLREREDELRTMVDAIPQLTWMARPDGHVYGCNRRFYEYTGTTPEQMEGWGWQSLHDPEVLPKALEGWKASLATGEPFEMEVPLRGKDGRFRRFLLRDVPLRDAQGRVVRWFGTATDITELIEVRTSLEEADRRKNEFLAMLSHELRNPLAPVRNSLYVLDRAAPGGEQARRAHAVIHRQVEHMTRLVDDLLDITRISRGKIQLKREPLDFADMVRRTVEDHRASFVTNRLALTATLPEGPLWVYGDRTRLAQVISNLLHNAAKFTGAGGTVSVSVERNDTLGQAVARVRDTGAGIAAEVLPRIFEPFIQADNTLERSKGGLGLGLAMVKGLCELHGGSASVASEGLGKGAELTVRLPLHAAPEAAEPARPPPRPAVSRRVLVIEDHVDGAESLREVLELAGHTVEVTYSGVEGLEKARSFAPEVVLCDIGLPGMNGYEVARAMRAEPALRSAKLVALTGYAGPEDIARAKDAGFDDHVAKPPGLEKLEEALLA